MSLVTRRTATAAIIAAGLAPMVARARTSAFGPPLWEARGTVGSAVLFGQMPVRSDTNWQSPTVMSAFAASKTLWVENPVFSRDEVEASIRRRAVARRLKTAEFLPSDDLNRLHAQLHRAATPVDAFDELPADDLFQQLGAVADVQSGADFSRLPERIFREKAYLAAKPIMTEWQALSEVIDFIPSAPHPIRLQLIRLGLDDFDMVGQMDERLQAWLNGDAQYFERLGAIIAHRYPDLTSRMSGDRNRRLAERLIEAMQSPGQHFVCVGIRHVTGPQSLQTIFEKKGLQVDRI